MKLLLLTTIIVFIVDVSGFVNEMKRIAFKALFPKKEYNPFRIKPFDCSLCMTFWSGLTTIVIFGEITLLNIFMVSMFALFAENIKHILEFLKDCIGWITNKATDYMYGINNQAEKEA